eukprot:5684851-Lingulodinium_polyedra.AAC.1
MSPGSDNRFAKAASGLPGHFPRCMGRYCEFRGAVGASALGCAVAKPSSGLWSSHGRCCGAAPLG